MKERLNPNEVLQNRKRRERDHVQPQEVVPIQPEMPMNMNVRANYDFPMPPSEIENGVSQGGISTPINRMVFRLGGRKKDNSVYAASQEQYKEHIRKQELQFTAEKGALSEKDTNQDRLKKINLEERVQKFNNILKGIEPFHEIVIRVHISEQSLKEISQDREIADALRIHYKDGRSRAYTLVKRAYLSAITKINFHASYHEQKENNK